MTFTLRHDEGKKGPGLLPSLLVKTVLDRGTKAVKALIREGNGLHGGPKTGQMVSVYSLQRRKLKGGIRILRSGQLEELVQSCST